MSSVSRIAVAASMIAVACGVIILGSVTVAAQYSSGAIVRQIAPPSAAIGGLTYGEWSAVWWKWALERTVDESPLVDATGENCHVAQTGNVFFLAGGLGGSYQRSCTIPAGTRLFFPVANAFCAAEGEFAAMRECASGFLEGATYSAEIDGVFIPDLERYRALSPPFALQLPEGNVFGVPGGTYEPAAADGVYLMMNPLTPGDHVIRFTATFDGGATLDVTYCLTVGPATARRPAGTTPACSR